MEKSADKMGFFKPIGEDELHKIDVMGNIFVYRKRMIDDDLSDWEDSTDEVPYKNEKGEDCIKRVLNTRKAVWCKFRNFEEIPYSQEEICEITGIDKPWKEFLRQEKDLLFMRLTKDIYHILLREIDKINEVQKKKDSKPSSEEKTPE